MSILDADVIRASLGEFVTRRLDSFEAFTAIESTNSHLMQLAAPAVGGFRVAVTDNQTAGRGRHGRSWQSPPGAGVCLSIGYTFASQPGNLPALTLAVGLGAIEALGLLGIDGVQIKWPNDLVAGDGKLGGILTEAQALTGGAVFVVTGIGLNVDLPPAFECEANSDWTPRVADLAGLAGRPPAANDVAARLIDSLCGTIVDYEVAGFAKYATRWAERDWLRGRELAIETPNRRVTGTAAGVSDDGALLVDTGDGTVERVTSGSVVLADASGVAS